MDHSMDRKLDQKLESAVLRLWVALVAFKFHHVSEKLFQKQESDYH